MVKNKIRAGYLFWTTAFLSLLPFIILSFFSHPGAEDYLAAIDSRTTSFWDAQKHGYHIWSGRFVSNFVNDLCIRLGSISQFYFLHTLVLFALTGLAGFFMLFSINKNALNGYWSRNTVLQASFVLLLLNIFLLADIPSNFYWFSAAFVYQLPVVLLFCFIGLLLRRFNSGNRSYILNSALIINIILLMGCNETMAIIITVLLLSAFIYAARQDLPAKKIMLVYFLVALVTGIIIFLSSGIMNRQRAMNGNTHYITVLPIIAFRVFMVFYNVFKEPLSWICMIFCFTAGMVTVPNVRTRNAAIFSQPIKIYFSLVALIIIIAVILTPLLILSKGSFPDRALNNIIMVAGLYLLVVSFIGGQSVSPAIISVARNKIPVYACTWVICMAMLLNTGYINAWKTVCSGYFYHAVMKDRDQQFEAARINHIKNVTIISYQQALQQKIKERFPNGGFKSFNSLVQQPPVTIPFFNEAEDTTQRPYFAYYGLEKINIQTDKP